MRYAYNLVSIQITKKEENQVELEYYTSDGKQPIVRINVDEAELPIKFGSELSQEEYTALLQLLLTPYGHLNLLERWLEWAENGTAIRSLDSLVKDTKSLLGIK